MKITLYLTDGKHLEIKNMPDGDVMDLRNDLEGLRRGYMTLDMDGATVLVNREQIVRVDMETWQDE